MSDETTTQPPEPRPGVPGAGGDRVEVAVVGGGLAGLVCAWRAARSGARTQLVDAPDRPAAAQVAAGMIAPVGEASWGEENLLRAGLLAASGWQSFADELELAAGRPVPYRRCGALHVGLDADEAGELRRHAELHRRLGLEAHELLGSECRELEPGLASVVRAGIEAPGRGRGRSARPARRAARRLRGRRRPLHGGDGAQHRPPHGPHRGRGSRRADRRAHLPRGRGLGRCRGPAWT